MINWDEDDFDIERIAARLCDASNAYGSAHPEAGQLASCMNEWTMTDVIGYKWCSEHAYRATVSAYGKRWRYPDLPCSPFAIGPGEYCWRIAIGLGTDDFLYMAHAAIENLESGVA